MAERKKVNLLKRDLVKFREETSNGVMVRIIRGKGLDNDWTLSCQTPPPQVRMVKDT